MTVKRERTRLERDSKYVMIHLPIGRYSDSTAEGRVAERGRP